MIFSEESRLLFRSRPFRISSRCPLRRTMTSTNSPVRSRTTIQRAAQIVGAVFLLVGVLGFIPGITVDFGSMSFAGH
ncbi:DUF4383 domain-containing protein, partial [Bacillus sp. SIMBA_031]|uniref:DUF4383 domain-containing protein n=1 Tax=Bacillus sp. SIMBA_031 TaxID=3085774 RepID=UPI00397CEEA8